MAMENQLREKELAIQELESAVANLKTEKEPLVSELLEVLESYNALSDALGGGGHGPVCFEAVGAGTSTEHSSAAINASGYGGAPLSDRTKYNLGLVENLQADVLRQRALTRELEAHVANLLQERETQEQVLQNLSSADEARMCVVSELHKQLETQTKARSDLEIELAALARGKGSLEDELSALRALRAKELEVMD